MKNNNKGFTAIELILSFQVLLVLCIGLAWVCNLYKLTKCDFEPSYKGEIIHAIGIIPPAALFTVWCDAK